MKKMDDAWKNVFDSKAELDVPDHEMSCWSKEGYEELFEVTKRIYFDMKQNKVIKKGHEEKKLSVLDVGCGPGAYCEFFHREGLSVTGVDYSENTVAKAKEKYPKINFLVANGYNLPFNDASFDFVISIGTLQCLYDHEKFVKELIRVSKRFVIISTLYRRKKSDDPLKILEKQLEKDSWPTREYHPSELTHYFEQENFRTKILLKNKGKLIRDGFFIVAEKINNL